MLVQASPGYDVCQPQFESSRDPLARIRLTRKEAALLAVLREHAGHCLSREYLLESVWGYRDGTRTRTLDVHIQRLRRKLGPHGSHILTIFRSGYAWSPQGNGESQVL